MIFVLTNAMSVAHQTLATGLVGGDFMKPLRIAAMALCGLITLGICVVVLLLLFKKKR